MPIRETGDEDSDYMNGFSILSATILTIGLHPGCSALSTSDSDAYGRYPRGLITEPSGLVASQSQSDVFWTHNDSGDEARIFAVTGRGALLAEFQVNGAEAMDWEAIATDDQGRLYVGDFGNNLNRRRDLVIYGMGEPKVVLGRQAGLGTLNVDMKIPFFYPEQKGFPDLKTRNFDAEALFWAEHKGVGTLYLLTKHRSNQQTVLYAIPAQPSESAHAARRVGHFNVGGDPDLYGGQVTGAALAPHGRYLAVLTYHAIFVFERPTSGENFLAHLRNRIDLEQGVTQQVEGIAWDKMALLVSNEQGRVFRLANPLEPYRGRFPRPTSSEQPPVGGTAKAFRP